MSNELAGIDIEIYSLLNLDEPKSFILFAGAGSGKTGSLVRVLKKFRNENINKLRGNAQKVAVITYTNAACDEIKRRLDFDASFRVSTIHNFCWELIRPYTEDIRECLRNELRNEISKLEAAQSKAKGRNKTFIEREIKIKSKKKRIDNLKSVRSFTYNPNGNNISRDSLKHHEVINLASDFIDYNPLMQKILIRKFPVLLIDESQDTKKRLIESLLKLQPNYASEFCMGLFGDTMQRVFTDGKEDLGNPPPKGWLTPAKKINYRCPKRVITLINKIRGDRPQDPGENNIEGVVRIFLVNSDVDNKKAIEEGISTQMSELTDDADWLAQDKVKILTLEHKMAARRGGFYEFYQPLYDGLKNHNTGLNDGKLNGVPFLVKKLLPLVNSLLNDDDFGVAEIMRAESPYLNRENLKAAKNQLELIKKANKSVNEIKAMWSDGKIPSTIDVIKKVHELGVFNLPELFKSIVKRDSLLLDLDLSDLDFGDVVNNDDERDDETAAWDAALTAEFHQLNSYYDYISDKSRFGTHQGVKGLEFPRVMVVLDDEEAGGNFFSYEKMLGAKQPSDNDLKKIDAGYDNLLAKTRRLFYVTCSRAEKSLAIVCYSNNPHSVLEFVRREDWFSENEIISL